MCITGFHRRPELEWTTKKLDEMEFEVHLGVGQNGSGTGFYKREAIFTLL